MFYRDIIAQSRHFHLLAIYYEHANGMYLIIHSVKWYIQQTLKEHKCAVKFHAVIVVYILYIALHTTLCDTVCQWLAAGQWIYPVTPVSSTNKLTATI